MTTQVFSSASACPLCGKPNACAAETEKITGKKQPACWCMQTPISDSLLARIPEGKKGMSCVCYACAQAQNALPSPKESEQA